MDHVEPRQEGHRPRSQERAGERNRAEAGRRGGRPLHSFRPGVMEGLDWTTRESPLVNPRIIYCSPSGYGKTVPLLTESVESANSGHVGYDKHNGLAERCPPHGMIPPQDCASGMVTAYAILVALLARMRTGVEQEVSLTLLNSAI